MRVPLPRLPKPLARAWTRFGDWSNTPLVKASKRDIRRIDVILILGGIFCASYYGITGGGWGAALTGLGMYVLVVMMALWMF
jgi:hypothetical protein